MSILVQDNFDRANSTTAIGAPQIGPSPVVTAGVGGISTNRLYASTATLIATWDAATPNVKLQANVTHVANSGRNFGFILGYVSLTDLWLVQFNDLTSILVQRYNNAGWVTYANTTVAPTTALLGVEHYDGILGVSVDGVRVATLDVVAIGAKPITNGVHGVRINHSTIPVDNLLVEDSTAFTIDSVGATTMTGDTVTQTSSASPTNTFLYRGRDTKAQDIAGGF